MSNKQRDQFFFRRFAQLHHTIKNEAKIHVTFGCLFWKNPARDKKKRRKKPQHFGRSDLCWTSVSAKTLPFWKVHPSYFLKNPFPKEPTHLCSSFTRFTRFLAGAFWIV